MPIQDLTADELDEMEFWKDLVFTDGKIDEEKVMRELLDYSDMMHRFSQFLDNATGGKMSKTNYTKGAMETEFDEYVNELIEDAVKEAIKDYEEEQEAERIVPINVKPINFKA